MRPGANRGLFSGEHAELVRVAVAGAEVEAGVHLGVAGALLQALGVRAGLRKDTRYG
jgi:hypothetical protein